MHTNEVKEMITKTEDCVFSVSILAMFMSPSFLSFSLNLFSVWIFVKKCIGQASVKIISKAY